MEEEEERGHRGVMEAGGEDGRGGADQWEEEGRRWEGSLRGQTPAVSGAEAVLVGGARDEGQLRSCDDSGKREEGGRGGGSVSIGSRSPVGVNVRRGTSTKVPPSAHSSSSSFISARSLQLHTCEKLHC